MRIADDFGANLELEVCLFEKGNFFGVFALLHCPSFVLSLLDGLALGLEFAHRVLQRLLVLFQLLQMVLHICLALLSLQSLAHAESHAAFIQRLVSSEGHANLVTDAKEQETALLA